VSDVVLPGPQAASQDAACGPGDRASAVVPWERELTLGAAERRIRGELIEVGWRLGLAPRSCGLTSVGFSARTA
jgi:hypothetical protein